MNDKILSFLGLAQRSGNLISGEDTCERLIRSNKVQLVLISGDASYNTQKKFKDMAKNKNIRCVILSNREELSKAIGKSNRTVYAIKDKGFAHKLHELLEEYKESPNKSGGEGNCQK